MNDPDCIHEIFTGSPEKFWKTPMLRKDGAQLMGQGLLLSEGELHRTQRKLMQPAFNYARIASYADTVVAHTLRMIENWQMGEVRDTLFGH